MLVRSTTTRICGGLAAVGLALTLAATGCGKKGPGDGSKTGPGAFGGEELDEGVAGRSNWGLEEARRLGLRTVYFDYDQSALRDDAKSDLRHNYDVLRQRSDVRVELQGNCDERGTPEYNFALGERRAKAVRDYLVSLGTDGDRMNTVSFGEENPAVVGHNEDAWSKNRRADFAVLR